MRTTLSRLMLLLVGPHLGCTGPIVGWPTDTKPVDPGDTEAPVVVWTNPGGFDAAVSVRTPVTAVFSETMDLGTINPNSFTLQGGEGAVTGAILVDGVAVTLVPSDTLIAGGAYVATVTSEATDTAGNPMESDYTWSFVAEELEEAPPTVIYTDPMNLSEDVDAGATVRAVFSEAMDPLTLNSVTFGLVDPGGVGVAGEVSYDAASQIVSFAPALELAPDSRYDAYVTTGAADVGGAALEDIYQWSFTVGPLEADSAPTVLATNPEDRSASVPATASVYVTFSEPMDPGTLVGSSVYLSGPGAVVVPGVLDYAEDTQTLEFDPNDDLEVDTVYTGTVTRDVTDLGGTPMLADWTWSFTVSPAPDTTAPYIIVTDPHNGSIDIAVDTLVFATFNEAMDPTSLTDTEVLLADTLGVPVNGQVRYDAATQTSSFTPDVALLPDNVYTVTVTGDAADLAGNRMGADYDWIFSTGPERDGSAPYVIVERPEDGELDVRSDVEVRATFNELIDPITLDAANFQLFGPLDVVVSGAVLYDASTQTGYFLPDEALLSNTTYVATVFATVADLAGNVMTDDASWTFTVAGDLDGSAPFVTATAPSDGATGVAVDADVTATFSEPMDSLSMSEAEFRVTGPLAVPVTGTVTYDTTRQRATFVPDVDLLASTTYEATIDAAVTDEAGNAMAANETWSFSTASVLVEVPPYVLFTDPDDGATEVSTASSVSATFSTMMDPLSFDETSFFVEDSLGPIPGTVSYDSVTQTVTFVPDADLSPGELYTATVTMDVTDTDGLSLVSETTWSFTNINDFYALEPVNLRSLEQFVAVAGAGLTNSNSAGITTLNGDVGLSPTATCLGDGAPCTLTNPVINGTLYANDAGGVAAQAKADLDLAYLDAMGRPPGTLVNDISGMTLPPGVYTSASTMSLAVGAQVILDGQGDDNAVWIFQVGSSMTVNNNAQVLLINGAQAKNVFWAVFASSTLGGDVSFQGTVLAGASNSVGTGSVVVGRLACTTGQITLLANNLTLPAP